MTAFNDHLEDIHQEISISDEDRWPYTNMFDNVKNWLLGRMCDVSPVFRKLYKGTRLFGSYSNRVRIIKPSEFDIFIVLGFPFPLIVWLDNDRPGFVHLDLENTLESLENDPNYYDVYDTFWDLVNNYYYLKRTSLQWWIHDIIEEVLETYANPYGYSIQYSKRSVAHTIYVGNAYRTISIDFVPAIQIGKVSWMHTRRYLPAEYFYNFLVIPKSLPVSRKRDNKLTFQLVNPMAERDILWDHQNLKVVYRLLKSLRNCYGLRRLKSYFLTTIFLWEVENNDEEFWSNSIDYLFIHMLAVLTDYFDDGNLPYFWVKGFNLLSILKPNERTKYAETLDSVWKTLKTYPYQYQLSYARACDHFEFPPDSESD